MTRVVLVPVCFGGRCGVEFVVLSQDLPPLLPKGILEKPGSPVGSCKAPLHQQRDSFFRLCCFRHHRIFLTTTPQTNIVSDTVISCMMSSCVIKLPLKSLVILLRVRSGDLVPKASSENGRQHHRLLPAIPVGRNRGNYRHIYPQLMTSFTMV